MDIGINSGHTRWPNGVNNISEAAPAVPRAPVNAGAMDDAPALSEYARQDGSRPLLPAPSGQYSSSEGSIDLEALLVQMMGQKHKSESLQIESEMESAKAKGDAAEKASQDRVEKMLDRIAEMEKQKALSRGNFFTKLLGKIAMAVVAVVAAVATVASFGAAAPLAVIAIAAAVYSVVDLALDITSEASGKDIRLGTIIAKGLEEAALAFGASEEAAKKIAQWGAMAVQLVIAVAACVGTGAGLAKVGGQLASVVKNVNVIIQSATAVASAGITAAEGVAKKAQTNIQADMLALQAYMAKMQMESDENRDKVKQLLDQLQSNSESINAMLTDQETSKQRIIAV